MLGVIIAVAFVAVVAVIITICENHSKKNNGGDSSCSS